MLGTTEFSFHKLDAECLQIPVRCQAVLEVVLTSVTRLLHTGGVTKVHA